MGRQIRGVLTIITVVALATVFGGWWAVPVVSFAAGFASPRGVRQAALIGICAGSAWLSLLALQTVSGVAIGDVATKVGQLFSLPGPAFLLLVVLFAFGLAWSCAALGEELGARLRKNAPAAVQG
jgi:hypothetical protein